MGLLSGLDPDPQFYHFNAGITKPISMRGFAPGFVQNEYLGFAILNMKIRMEQEDRVEKELAGVYCWDTECRRVTEW
jgi:hypothetical protein